MNRSNNNVLILISIMQWSYKCEHCVHIKRNNVLSFKTAFEEAAIDT